MLPKIESKIFKIPFSRHSIFFYPETTSIFRIDPIIRDILIFKKEASFYKKQIIDKLLKKYDLKQIEEAFDELHIFEARGAFKKSREYNESEYEKMLMKRKIKNIDIYLTHVCNMACSYCCNKGGGFGIHFDKKMMDWKTAKKTIDWFFLYNKMSKEPLTICFFGGEPLLNLPVFKKSIFYINKKFSKKLKVPLRLILSTNGTLLNKDVLNLISRNNVQLFVSLDSCKDEHDAKRVFRDGGKTYDIVLKNIKYAEKHFPNIEIASISTTNHKANMGNIFNKKDIPLDSNVKKRFNVEYNFSQDKRKAGLYLKNFNKEIKKYYLSCLKNGKKFTYMDTESFGAMHNRGNKIYNRGNCGAGIIKVSIAANGDIYVCGLSLFDKKWKIGSVFSGVSSKKVKRIIRKYVSIRKIYRRHCLDCWLRTVCTKSCVINFKKKQAETSLSFEERKIFLCNMAMLSFEYALRSYVDLSAEDAIAYFGSILESEKTKQGLKINEKIKLTYLYRDLVNKNFKHIQYLNPLFKKG